MEQFEWPVNAFFLCEFVWSVLGQSFFCLFIGETSFEIGWEFFFEFSERDFVVLHGFELFSELNGLIEWLLFLDLAFDLNTSFLDDLMEVSHSLSIHIEFHIVLSFGEGRNKHTGSLATHIFKINVKIEIKFWIFIV
jgi:hypothetical protein